MNVTKILCPVDFSDLSNAAIEYASTLAKESDALLILLHVEAHPLAYGTSFAGYGRTKEETEENTRRLHQIRPSAPDVAYEHWIFSGDPAETIVKLAKDEEIDLIVIGTHGRGGLTRLLMGSVAEVVVRKAHCPVLAVKQPENVLQQTG